MPGKPKEKRTTAALAARALQDIGEEATPLDYVCSYVADGNTLADLASSLATELGEPVSRQHISGTAHALSDDAKERIAAARKEGALAMVDATIKIADDSEATAGGAAKARLQISSRQWTAERFNRDVLGDSKPQINVSLGGLFLAALQQPAPPRPSTHFDATVPLLLTEGNVNEPAIRDLSTQEAI